MQTLFQHKFTFNYFVKIRATFLYSVHLVPSSMNQWNDGTQTFSQRRKKFCSRHAKIEKVTCGRVKLYTFFKPQHIERVYFVEYKYKQRCTDIPRFPSFCWFCIILMWVVIITSTYEELDFSFLHFV